MAFYAKTAIARDNIAVTTSRDIRFRAAYIAMAAALGSLLFPTSGFAQTANETAVDIESPQTLPAISQNTAIDGDANMSVEILDTPEVLTLTPRSTARRNSVWKTRTLTRSSKPQVPLPAIAGTPIDADIALKPMAARSDFDGNAQIDAIQTAMRGTLFTIAGSPDSQNIFRKTDTNSLCLDTSAACLRQDRETSEFTYGFDLTKDRKGLDFQISPRANVVYDNDGSQSALLGALVRIGDNLRTDDEMADKTWYLFAGADAEAVTYTPSSFLRLAEGGQLNLRNRIIVGDAQAGIGYRMGGADLALTYFRRQSRVEDWEFNEDAAALSLTWRR